MMASSSTDYQGPMPMDVDRVQTAQGKGKKGKNDQQKGKGKDAKGKGKKGKGKGNGRKGKGVATCHTCGKPGHLAKDCWRNHIRHVASDQTHSSSGGASVTTHTVGLALMASCPHLLSSLPQLVMLLPAYSVPDLLHLLLVLMSP